MAEISKFLNWTLGFFLFCCEISSITADSKAVPFKFLKLLDGLASVDLLLSLTRHEQSTKQKNETRENTEINLKLLEAAWGYHKGN